MPTVYALSFITVLLAIAWLIDRQARRVRRGLVRPASIGLAQGRPAYRPFDGAARRTLPGPTGLPQGQGPEGTV